MERFMLVCSYSLLCLPSPLETASPELKSSFFNLAPQCSVAHVSGQDIAAMSVDASVQPL